MIEYNFDGENMLNVSAKRWYDVREQMTKTFGPNLDCIEIGSWEGRSAIYIADNIMGDGKLTLIDLGVKMKTLYKNLQQHPKSKNFEFLFGDSFDILAKLTDKKEAYHFIFIDGSKYSCDNLYTLLVAERLLKKGGFIIVDDYRWNRNSEKNAKNTPKLGVDLFLKTTLLCEPYDLTGYQAIIMKTKDNKLIKVNNTV
jgi:predicted O-methyltransferase YrrM